MLIGLVSAVILGAFATMLYTGQMRGSFDKIAAILGVVGTVVTIAMVTTFVVVGIILKARRRKATRKLPAHEALARHFKGSQARLVEGGPERQKQALQALKSNNIVSDEEEEESDKSDSDEISS